MPAVGSNERPGNGDGVSSEWHKLFECMQNFLGSKDEETCQAGLLFPTTLNLFLYGPQRYLLITCTGFGPTRSTILVHHYENIYR